MLSEHTIEGMLEGYLLTGRHGFISIVRIVRARDRLDVQPARQMAVDLQSPVVEGKHRVAEPTDYIDGVETGPQRIHSPGPGISGCGGEQERGSDADLSAAGREFAAVGGGPLPRSENYVNVIVCDKQLHLQYMDMDAAIQHCTKGIGIWEWACNDQGSEPDVVMASAGDIPTQESLAAIVLLREEFPDVKIRYVNVVDLFKMQPNTEHPHGLSDRDFDSLFTVDKPIIFNFHGYPVADSPAGVPANESRRHARARVQGKGEHQYADGVGD